MDMVDHNLLSIHKMYGSLAVVSDGVSGCKAFVLEVGPLLNPHKSSHFTEILSTAFFGYTKIVAQVAYGLPHLCEQKKNHRRRI